MVSRGSVLRQRKYLGFAPVDGPSTNIVFAKGTYDVHFGAITEPGLRFHGKRNAPHRIRASGPPGSCLAELESVGGKRMGDRDHEHAEKAAMEDARAREEALRTNAQAQMTMEDLKVESSAIGYSRTTLLTLVRGIFNRHTRQP